MNLKILFMLGVYWTIFILITTVGGSTILTDEGITTTAQLNSTELSANETDTGGLFGSGVSFGRYFAFVAFGIGLPESTPSWFQVMFFAWQTLLSVFTVGFIISSIWNG